MIRLSVLAATFVFFASCCHKDSNSGTTRADIVRIQQYGGMRLENKVYEISDEAVKQDTSFRTGDTVSYLFNITLPDAKHEKVLRLLHEIPMQLLSENNILLGDPKFEVDGTATYVFIYRDGKKYTYLLADDVSTLPEYLREYALAVQQAFADLK